MKTPLFLILLVTILSCTSTKKLPRVDATLEDLIPTSWVLHSFNGQEVSKNDYMKGLPALNFRENGGLDGMTGCNSFSGKYSLGNTTKINPGAMTKMNCPGSREADFLGALRNTTSLVIEGSDLLFLKFDEVLLRFTPAPKN